jgi:hypothetical protein
MPLVRASKAASLSGLFVLLSFALCSAQGTTVNAVRGRISERIVVGSTTLGEVLRVVGSPTVSSGTGTMNPVAFDADGDAVEDTNTTVSTAGAWTFGGAGSFTSTLGVTGVLSGNTGTLLLGSPTRISGTTPSFRIHESDGGSSAKYWNWEADTESFYLKLCDDTPSSCNNAFRLDRAALVPGDWRWGSLLTTIRPENNGTSDLGSYTKMYRAAYFWDLIAQTITAKEVISTIGGEIIVAPTTSLTRDVATGDAFIFVKHNQLRNNDTVFLKVNGSGEKMLVTSNYIDCSVSGNCVVAGTDFAYGVTRNRQGSGAKAWLAGAAVVNEGNVGDGNMSLFADRSSSVSDGYVGVVVSDGPVAYFRMPATTPTTSADLMGNVGVATETGTQSAGLGVGALAVGTTGADPAWQNTGGAGSLTVANDSDLQITADLTIEFIAYWEHTVSRLEHILSRSFNGEYYVDVDAAGVLRFCHGNGSTFECEVTTSAAMPVGSWHHYAIVRDAQSSPKRILFYVDGVLHTTATYTQAVTTSTNTLYIGDTSGGSTQFDGYIDELAIYNYQLTADRILLHSASRANDSISKFTIGPTIIGNVRTGTGAFDISERWALGNLAGTYGYATSPTAIYGFAAGNASATWISADATNGFRIMNGSTVKTQFDTSGNGSLTGDLAIGANGSFRSGATAYDTTTGYWLDYNGGTPRFRIGTTSAGTSYFRWTGSAIDMKSNTLSIDSTGIIMAANTSSGYATNYGYRFSSGLSNSTFGVHAYETAGGRTASLVNSADTPGKALDASLFVGTSGGNASVRVFNDNAGNRGVDINAVAAMSLSNQALSISSLTVLQINGVSGLSTTVVVPCGTLTFTHGWLTNKGTC